MFSSVELKFNTAEYKFSTAELKFNTAEYSFLLRIQEILILLKILNLIVQSILLRHLEAHAHAIVVIHNAAHGTHRSAAGKIQLAQGLDQGEQLLLLEEKADAIGGAGGKTRSTQQQALQLNGMRLLIEGIGTVP
jgi:hypothetical protein